MALRASAFVAILFASPILAADPPKADQAGFKATVVPFLNTHCVRCHGEKKQEGKLSLHDISADIVAGKHVEKWQEVAERLKLGEMPPEGEKQPDPVAIKKVTDWIDGELKKAGKTVATKAGSLRTGNKVPHELLFGATPGAPLESPPRIWRLSPYIYGEWMKEVAKNAKLSAPFSLPSGEGFKDLASAPGLDESTAAQLIRNAEAVVNDQFGIHGKGKKPPAEFVPLLAEDKPPTKAQIEAAITKQFQIILKRKPDAEELKRFVDLHEKNVKSGGALIGTRTTLMTVLLLPESSFRSELGKGPAVGGKRMLSPREIAFAVSFALTDRPPDAKLLEAADSGKLSTPEQIAGEVKRIFDDPKADKARVMRFFREYFGYAEAVNVFKDDKLNKNHEPKQLVADTDKLIRYVLDEDKDVIRQLLTTDKSFVAYSVDFKTKAVVRAGGKNKDIASSYNVTDWTDKQPMALPAGQRAGVLTQPSWLVAHSDNFDNHAIRRGKWVRERLLGGVVPDVPITVDAQLPQDPQKTLRQRMEVTKEAYCWQCHQKMNPIGLGFENFDHFGRYRTTELDKPVDSAAVIDGTGDPKVDGNYPDSVQMLRKLADTDRVRQVFIRYAFRYWMGREENAGDARTLQAADKAYRDSGGSMKALITSLLTSESFLYRTQ